MSYNHFPAGVTELPGDERYRCPHCDEQIDPLAGQDVDDRCVHCGQSVVEGAWRCMLCGWINDPFDARCAECDARLVNDDPDE